MPSRMSRSTSYGSEFRQFYLEQGLYFDKNTQQRFKSALKTDTNFCIFFRPSTILGGRYLAMSVNSTEPAKTGMTTTEYCQ